MGTTYLELTNRVLRRINDVAISESDFPAVIGIHAAAKDAVLDTVREINNMKIDWPFNAVEHTQTLVAGSNEYAWPTDFVAADWNSFQIQADDTLNINNKLLKVISREEWYRHLKDQDDDAGADGISIPDFAFPSHGQGFGVSPVPNEVYTIKYRYYKSPIDLSLFDDTTTIPSRWDYVITAGALYHMNLFKENPEGVQIMKAAFDKGIRDMVNEYLPNPIYIYDTRVNFGGGTRRGSGYLWYLGRGA